MQAPVWSILGQSFVLERSGATTTSDSSCANVHAAPFLQAPRGKNVHILVFWQNLVRFGRDLREWALARLSTLTGDKPLETAVNMMTLGMAAISL